MLVLGDVLLLLNNELNILFIILRKISYVIFFRRAYRAKRGSMRRLEAVFYRLVEFRIDTFLSRLGFASLGKIRQFIRHGLIFVNGKKVCRCNYTLKTFDRVSFGYAWQNFGIFEESV